MVDGGGIVSTMIEVRCECCGVRKERPLGEVNRSRKLGRRFFCSRSCTAKTANIPKKSKQIVVTCPCGKRVKTSTRRRSKKHCSRKCAATYSYSKTERSLEASRLSGLVNKINLLSTAEVLKRREAWKYVMLERVLRGRDHEFEYEVGGRVFDLALLDVSVLVEFDGPYHSGEVVEDDRRKDEIAEAAGFMVVRRSVIPSTVISSETIGGL